MKNGKKWALGLCIGLIFATVQVAQAGVKLVESNANYRIAELTLAPNESFNFTPAALSSMTVIQGGTAELTRDGQTKQMTYVRGQAIAQSSAGSGQAELKNTGTTTLDLLIIAIK